MKLAIVSDIHGNLEALQAVLADIETQHVDRIYCMGDVVGYGPNPRECVDQVMQFDLCILGNHDQGAIFDPEGFSGPAERAIFWTRNQLEIGPSNENGNEEEMTGQRAHRWSFLCNLRRVHREDPYMFVHGSVRNPLNEYVFPEDVFNKKKIDSIFKMVPKYAFQGHTHVPGVFTTTGTFLRPDELKTGYRLGEQKVMVNVGSVGQPRDGDTRACYVILEDDMVHYRRVPYPLDAVMQKIYAVEELDDFLADRLRQGR